MMTSSLRWWMATALFLVIVASLGCSGELEADDEEPTQEEDVGVEDADTAGDAEDGDVASDAESDGESDTGDADDDYEVPEGMELVDGGTFRRGCDPDLDDDCRDQEMPAHEVTLSAFVIDRFPVTEREYEDCVEDEVCDGPIHDSFYDGRGDDYPVVNIPSEQAITYCEWAEKRLPTEAEWEKAARGTDERIYPWGDDEPDCSLANFDDCGGDMEPVGHAPDGVSPWGVEEMVGNVRHWTADWFDGDYYEDSPDEDPQGPDSGTTRSVRGGSFFWGEDALRASARNSMEGGADSYSDEVGFRCAKTVE